ncbi:MAG TPA: ankyrin repeat domain-containing protein [Vineibacter sp.]|nr:ankyrin repeat domain-containing protein [Vineibacter sp.]
MPRLPDRPNLDHLKKQAKDLLALWRAGDRVAINRFRLGLPAVAGKDDATIARLGLRLHDAQSCIAREYGFPSWADLRRFVELRAASGADPAARLLAWLRLVYAADIAGGNNLARPALAARLLEDDPGLVGDDPYVACAIGNEDRLRRAMTTDPGWVGRVGGPLNLPPLVAVAHSGLLRLPAWRDRLHACARFLLQAGADVNQPVGSRWPPASLNQPSAVDTLSALYGAAGRNHDPDLTQLLLQAGANPNDGESLYHALENNSCTRLLLDAGARIVGTNAMYRVLDFDNLSALEQLLKHGADPNEPATSPPTSDWGSPLLWAIRRRRSPGHIAALLRAGADPMATTPDGVGAHAWALRFGLPEVADLLASTAGAAQPAEEQFIAACARGDEATARHIQSLRPDLPRGLSETQLRLLPELAADGHRTAVELMVALGWPIAVAGGDWKASALNHAVFRGDAGLTRFLLEHGASWRERHGHGDDVCGTLSWASWNEPVDGGDWVGCAEALVAHGMPRALPDPADSTWVVIDGRRKRFSDEVTDFLLEPADARPESTTS